MEIEQLRSLFETTMKRTHELRLKYERGFGVSRQDCLELRRCNKRLRTVAFELWVMNGKPEGLDILRNPPEWQPFPWAKPLDLTGRDEAEVH